jgi:hypothetical protein
MAKTQRSKRVTIHGRETQACSQFTYLFRFFQGLPRSRSPCYLYCRICRGIVSSVISTRIYPFSSVFVYRILQFFRFQSFPVFFIIPVSQSKQHGARSCSDNALELYSTGTWFESRIRHRLSSKSSFVFFIYPYMEMAGKWLESATTTPVIPPVDTMLSMYRHCS